MGQLRTIDHAGIEIQEVDASGSTEQVGGCTSLVVGFFPQGESATPVNPTSLKSVKSYFGTPETEAERYSYYACKSVFDNGGKLIAARIPYDNNSQYITPAVKYNIKEWSTTHVVNYNSDTVNNYVLEKEKNYDISDYMDKTSFTIDKSPVIDSIFIETTKTIFRDGTEEIDGGDINIINSSVIEGTSGTYYTLSFNGPFYVDGTASFYDTDTVGEKTNVDIKSCAHSFVKAGDSTYTSISAEISSSSFIDGHWSFTSSDGGNEKTFGETGQLHSGKIVAQKGDDGFLNGTFKIYQYIPESASYSEEIATIDSLIFQDTNIDTGMELDRRLFTNEYAKYFNIKKHVLGNPVWEEPGTAKRIQTTGYYNETRIDDDTKYSNFRFDGTRNQPTTAWVETLGSDTDPVTAMAIKSYWDSGDGLVYPSMDEDGYLELRIWDNTKITALSSLTVANSGYYDIIENVYVGKKTSESTVITDSSFKSAPVTSDVTVGYKSADGKITSELMSIKKQDTWNPDVLPDFIEVDNPVGTGKIHILSRLSNGESVATTADPVSKWRDDFYQFVSPYSSVKDIALAKSENYKWIHYTTNRALTADGDYKNHVLMSGTLGCATSAVPDSLSKIENVVTIVPDEDNLGYIPLSDYLDYRDEAKKVDSNTIVIANITEQKFEKDIYNNSNDEVSNGEEVLGIVPVLMTGFQSLPKQSRIQLPDSITNSKIFNALETIIRGASIENDPAPSKDHVDVKSIELNGDGFVRTLGSTESYDPYESTYSNTVLGKVPSIDLNSYYKPNGTATNNVTLAVCKLSISSVNDNKVALTVLESFTGSLDSTAKDDKGNSIFIDTIVNNDESGSAYVKLFSNYNTTLVDSTIKSESCRKTTNAATNDTKITVVVPESCGTDNWWSTRKRMQSLGFTEKQTNKYISYATMVASIENIYDVLSNVDEEDIDIVVDAGLTSIANRIKKYVDANPEETKCEYDLTFDKINSVTDVAGWKSMAAKLITFCQTTRKDCMALIDAPRSLCVKNNAKLIDSKKTTTSKYSVDYDILPKFNYLGGLNSSYGAGFCDWILAVDDFTAKNIWMPPSIAAEGNIIYTDYNSNYWMAPAGEKRGNITWAVDIAFNPSGAQQDSIYSKGWNYAVSVGGNIMTWGQKTFLTSTSSFNRINVRRLFLRLERLVRKNSKWVVFELNNQKTRNTYLDRIDPIFANVKAMGGLYDYQIICDYRVNTNEVAQNNEFRSCFLLKPTPVSEYIVLTFFNLNLTSDFSEVYGEL